MLQLWESNITKAAKLVLGSGIRATDSSKFWTLILKTPSKEIEPELGPAQENPELHWIAALITCKEI